MSKTITLSLVVPMYNEEDYLAHCLDAIARQTIAPHEVIIVDNNSTDKTLDIAKRYPFVRILHEPEPGVLAARTRGFSAARGDIIGRIDADTILNETWVAQVLDFFTQSDAAAVTGPVEVYDLPFARHNYRLDNFIRRHVIRFGGRTPLLFGANMAIRRSAWQAIKRSLCVRRDLHEDIDMAIHLQQAGHRVAYDAHLRPQMSSRRYDSTLSSFIPYNRLLSRSYRLHGLSTFGPRLAQAIYFVCYFGLWPLRRSYDVKTRSRSLKRLLHGGNQPRKNPMDA
jgi:glycosyltransferase involved in cell wall biosynthesis